MIRAGTASGNEPIEVTSPAITTQRLSVLANVLFVAAALIAGLAVITALALATSQQTLGIFETFERQSRDLAALATLMAGITGAALVAGVGGILKALLQVIPPDPKRLGLSHGAHESGSRSIDSRGHADDAPGSRVARPAGRVQ